MNESDEEIPVPTDSGTDGTQLKGASTGQLIRRRGMANAPLAAGIIEIATDHARAYGNEVNTRLVASFADHFQWDNAAHREAAKEAQRSLEASNARANQLEVRCARLEERLRSARSSQMSGNIMLIAGSALVSVAIDLFTSEGGSGVTAAILLISGGVLLIAGLHKAKEPADAL